MSLCVGALSVERTESQFFIYLFYPQYLDSSVAKGYRLVGDVDYESCKPIASWITPVPGGEFS